MSSARCCSGGGVGFGGAQWRELLAGVPAAQFAVGGDGQLPLLTGCCLPLLPVGHDRGEDVLAFAVGVVHGLVAGRQGLLLTAVSCWPWRWAVPASAAARMAARRASAAPSRTWRSSSPVHCGAQRGFDGVGVAQVQQRPVGHAADVGAVDGAERRQGLVPGSPQVRVGGGFGADRVGGVGVAGQFPVGADRGGPLLPLQPVHRMFRGPGRGR